MSPTVVKIAAQGALLAMQESLSFLRGQPIDFCAHVYSPHEDSGDRYAEYDVSATNQGIALEALTHPLHGVFWPEMGDRLLELNWDDPREWGG